MSFKVGIRTRKMTDGSWAFNALRFAHREDAERYPQDLFGRWNQVKSYTIEKWNDDPNATDPVPSDRYDVEKLVSANMMRGGSGRQIRLSGNTYR